MRTWFLTSTTYGSWLPGDKRGFVSNHPDDHQAWVRHNLPDTPWSADDAERRELAESLLNGPPIYLTQEQAQTVVSQFLETASYRHWNLHGVAVMASHFHTAISADDAVESVAMLRDLKSYASRRLNQQWTRPDSGTWWTESGSRRPVRDDTHFANIIRYLADQPLMLASWIDPALLHLLKDDTNSKDFSERGA